MLLKEIEHDQEEQVKGWVCPKCQGAIAPHVQTCPTCEQSKVKEGSIPQNKQVLMG